MSTMIPDSTTIRAMDGPALTRLAYQLGLAPDSAQPPSSEDDFLYDFTARERWDPHVNLVQADAVLRKLREYGWSTSVEWSPKYGFGEGRVTQGNEYCAVNWGPGYDITDEAHALLLVACLARAVQVREDQP